MGKTYAKKSLLFGLDGKVGDSNCRVDSASYHVSEKAESFSYEKLCFSALFSAILVAT